MGGAQCSRITLWALTWRRLPSPACCWVCCCRGWGLALLGTEYLGVCGLVGLNLWLFLSHGLVFPFATVLVMVLLAFALKHELRLFCGKPHQARTGPFVWYLRAARAGG